MAFDVLRAMKSVLAEHPEDRLMPLFTPWAEQLIESGKYEKGDVLQDYPRPQMRRESYMNLNGWWECSIKKRPDGPISSLPDFYDEPILVPFSPEALLSGVEKHLEPDEVLWYRRSFEISPKKGHRYMLNFEAVDYECECWVNGQRVGGHEGAYSPFSFDITSALADSNGSVQEVVLAVFDPTESDVQPRGKQRLGRGSIWYTAQSGIWQTVWLEEVPDNYVSDIRIDADLDDRRLSLILSTEDLSPYEGFIELSVTISDGSLSKTVTETVESSLRELSLSMDLDDVRPWSPNDPHLYKLQIRYGADVIESYCAFRSCTIEKDVEGKTRFFLNHEPFFMKGLLDQGYWPDGLMTAPSDEALAYDIEFAKNAGFNMLRKHIKVECRRWYYHCDIAGMLVWQDIVNGGGDYSSFHVNKFPTVFPGLASNYDDRRMLFRFGSNTKRAQELWFKEAVDTIKLLRNHPCIVTWVVFNEGWGQFNANEIIERLRAVDGTRPFDQASGWFDQGGGDFVSEHNYFRDLRVPRNLRLDSGHGRAKVISEFGGATYHVACHSSLDRSYGYDIFEDIEAYKEKVRSLIESVSALEADGLSGFVYTQLADVEEEVNGLLTYDRRVSKI